MRLEYNLNIPITIIIFQMRFLYSLCYLLTAFLFLFSTADVKAAGQPSDWITIGSTNAGPATFDLLYYKLLQVNGDSHRYASILEVNIQGDVNYFDRQATYRIRVDKFENVPGRFDGLEISCISGNPAAGTFYVFNNAVWIRSNFQWGTIAYRPVAEFGTGTPLNIAPFGQTITAPVGFLATTNNYGLACDFDNNQFYPLPIRDVKGNITIPGKVGIGTVANYNLHSLAYANTNKASAYLWGENYGVAVGTLNATAGNYAFAVMNNANPDGSSAPGGGKQLLYVRGDGNVGIGTSVPQATLAVNGDIFAKKIKVTQTGWPDFVFKQDYPLPSLQEVANFIIVNKHLKDIPSEKEVSENGIDLGEMNKKLLQKIEELTLYIIDLKKESEQQQQRILKLENKTK
jgi:hypothetical protein